MESSRTFELENTLNRSLANIVSEGTKTTGTLDVIFSIKILSM